MHRIFAVAIVGVLLGGTAWAAEGASLAVEKDRISYSVGYQMGGDFKRQGLELSPEAMVRGIQDALSGAAPAISETEMSQTLVDLKQKVMAAQQKAQQEQAAKNEAAGKAFLAENAKKKGVNALPSGLQYEVLKEGEGEPPKATDTVTVHYKGTLIDGAEFDSSYSRNQPATFALNRVIKGWTEGLQLMKPGARYRFFVPPELAYGARGAGPKIGPQSTLVFDVELLSVGEAKPAGKKAK